MELSEHKDIDSLLKKSEKEYDPSELSLGIEIEKEHSSTYEWIKAYHNEHGVFPDEADVYEKIAKDHLNEYEDYYTRLKKVES